MQGLEISSLHSQLSSADVSDLNNVHSLLASYCKLLEKSMVFKDELFDYFIFPLLQHLKSGNTATLMCAQGFNILVKRHSCTTSQRVRLINVCAQLLEDKKLSEETHLEAVKICLMLLKDASIDWKVFSNRALFGYLLSQLLDCCTREKLRELRLLALRASNVLFFKFNKTTAASFYPGFLSTIQRVCCGDFKQGTAITVLALKTFCQAIVLFFETENKKKEGVSDPLMDFREPQKKEEKAIVEVAVAKQEKSKEKDMSFLIEIDEEWLEMAGKKVLGALEKVVRYLHKTYAEEHDESEVREALAHGCGELLGKCMSICNVRMLCDVLVLYSNDEWSNVANEAKEVLQQHRPLIVATVRTSLHDLVVLLPRIIRSSTDAEKLTKLKLTCGYAMILGPTGLPATLVTSVSNVVESITQVLSVDRHWGSSSNIAKVSVLADMKNTPTKLALEEPRLLVWLSFCASEILKKWALLIPKTIAGDLKSASFFYEYLFQQIEACCEVQRAENLGEYVLFCAQMYLGYPDTDGSLLRLTRRLLNVIVTGMSVNNVEDKMALTLSCYLIGCSSYRMEKQFSGFVALCLPFLLKCLGNEDYHVSASSWNALENVTLCLKQSSVHELIRNNADYVINEVVNDLRASRLSKTVRTPYIVSGILNYSPTNATWLLDDVLEEVMRSLDASAKTKEELTIFTKILAEISAALLNAVEQEEGVVVQDHKRNEEEEEETPKPTQSQMIATRMINRVRHFVSSKELNVQAESIKCISNCLLVLSKNRRELLPAVYAVWDPFMKRLESKQSSLVIVIKVSETLGLIAKLATDFLSGEKFERMFRSFVRMIQEFLKENPKRTDPYFTTTLMFKSMLSIVKCLLNFCIYVPLNAKKREELMNQLNLFKGQHSSLAEISELGIAELSKQKDDY